MIALAVGCCFLVGALFVGWKLDMLARALERYGDRAFGVEEALRRLERESNMARAKTDPKRRKS